MRISWIVLYSLSATDEVGYDIHSTDDVMAAGFNWRPSLTMIEALSAIGITELGREYETI